MSSIVLASGPRILIILKEGIRHSIMLFLLVGMGQLQITLGVRP